MEEGQKDVAATKSSAYRQLLLLLMILGLSLLSVPAWALTLTTDETIGATDYTYDGTDLVIDGATVEIAGEHTFTSLTLINGAVLTHPVGYADGVTLNVAGTVEIDATSQIALTGRGLGREGPGGSATAYVGASYGGHGGVRSGGSSVASYGVVSAPTELGSGTYQDTGSTSAAHGGGALKLVADALVLDGHIYADGEAGETIQFGGGSGGSVWLQVGALSGAGKVYARGGNGRDNGASTWSSPGGGGGRIAIYYGELLDGFDLSTQVLAYGGVGYHIYPAGAAGTVYLQHTGSGHRILRVDNSEVADTPTLTDVSGVVADELQIYQNDTRIEEYVYDGTNLVIDDSIVEMAGEHTFTSITLRNNAVLRHPTGYAGGLAINAGTINIDATSRIALTGRGYGSEGPGGTTTTYVGASHGGHGGVRSGGSSVASYGVVSAPTELGSGTYLDTGSTSAAHGGGALKLVADALVLDGHIYADGEAGETIQFGGGSGGSVWLQVGALSGAGKVYARGGNGHDNGASTWSSPGGGGGRIAIYYGELLDGFDLSTQVLAYGGVGYHIYPAGAAGTVYLENTGSGHRVLRVDNREVADTPALTDASGVVADELQIYHSNARLTVGTVYDNQDLVIEDSVVEMAGEYAFASVTLRNEAVLKHPVGHVGGLAINAGTISIDATSRIALSGRGYGNEGPGGTTTTYVGASHGGQGGVRTGNSSVASYGIASAPTELGSGTRATTINTSAIRGGGALKLVADALVLEGHIYADGETSNAIQYGGASGGSVWVQVGALSGSGKIYARGGGGHNTGGSWSSPGGGGGRIAIYYGELPDGFDLSTQVLAHGGAGYYIYQAGAAGTVYLQNTGSGHRILRVDNSEIADTSALTDASGVAADEL